MGIVEGGGGLGERSGKDAETEKDEDDAEYAIHFVRALARNVLRAHDDALAPDLKAHHQVRPDDIHPAKNEKNKPDDVLFHPPILHQIHITSFSARGSGSDIYAQAPRIHHTLPS